MISISSQLAFPFELVAYAANRLRLYQVLFLMRLGREINCHAAINYLCRESGYSDPQPIEPEDEKARLQREFIEAQKAMGKLADRMERFGLLKAVA